MERNPAINLMRTITAWVDDDVFSLITLIKSDAVNKKDIHSHIEEIRKTLNNIESLSNDI